ncbi:hypothetical protein [Nocardioides sp.]|jgi:hypothetical protein|uniref:hypothetical protein n=1 Tax=Nocardioides sp. TaxID=35761 RepID=UPI00261E1819|nr:hypothetical protein [Nocardioides sp.]
MPAARLARVHATELMVLGGTTAILSSAGVLAWALHRSGGDLLVTFPLALLGLVGVTLASLDLAWARHHDLLVARLRGVHGVTALRVVAAPAWAAVLLGTIVGPAAASGFLGAAPARWPTPDRWGVGEGVAAAAVGLICAGVATGTTLTLFRLPIAATFVSGRTARQPLTPAAVARVAGIGLVVLAAITLYRATQPSAASSAVVLAGAGVGGLTVGQLAVWGLRGLSRTSAGRRTTAGLLGVRRATSTEHAPRLRLAVAAAIVGTAAWSGAAAADAWGHESEALRVGAAISLYLPETSALQTWQLTQELDPEGRWLMAAAVKDDRDESELRVAYLDVERYERVAGPVLDATTGSLAGVVEDLRDAPGVEVFTGARLTASAHHRPARGGGERARTPSLRLSVEYLDGSGVVQKVELRLRPDEPDQPDALSGEIALPQCEVGCVLLGLTATGRSRASGRLTLDTLVVDDTDVSGDGWVSPDGPADEPPSRTLALDRRSVPAAARTDQPVLTAGDPSWTDGPARVVGIGGGDRPITRLGSRAALPLVLGAGLVGDLPVALAGSRGSVSGVRSVVLARGDTPPDLLTALVDRGADEPVRIDPGSSRALGPSAAADLHLRTLVAVGSGLLALAALLGGARGRRGAARRDAASLRVIGIVAGVRRRARLVEALLLGTTVLAATSVGGWLTMAAVTHRVRLVPTGPARLPEPDAVDATSAVVAAALAAVVWMAVLLVAGRERRVAALLTARVTARRTPNREPR